KRLVNALRRKTFAHFPSRPPKLNLTTVQEFAGGTNVGSLIDFTSEEGIVLRAKVFVPQAAQDGPSPAFVFLRSPDHERWEFEGFTGHLDPKWIRAAVDVRGVGATSWSPSLQRHLRRASAIIGCTIGSMRVWDALRALEAVRQLPGVDGERMALAAKGEMCAVALYAALLDGNVNSLVLADAPETQNAPSRPDGTGPTIEMLNCLRLTDLPYIAGLLWPTELVFFHSRPETYQWSEELYRELGEPGAVRHIQDIGQWIPQV
ncbi:MAG: hypothetical protein KAX80_15450, partial [Planctomycetes bacterium]|nr:hypothetical protein [Planctomycetota bacterium]